MSRVTLLGSWVSVSVSVSVSVYVCVFIALLYEVNAWPGMQRRIKDGDGPDVGPVCTVNAHGWWPDEGPCPNMPQPPPPVNTSTVEHVWPNNFIVQWSFVFVPDDSDAPPYTPLPRTPFNMTTGRTYYHEIDPVRGLRNMREQYDSFCIPVFGDPTNPMGARNDYSCDFLNVGITNTSYVLLHDDRPAGAPECCIIGRPFHAPPREFGARMPVKWRANVNGTSVDWNAVFDLDAGIFNYGFNVANSEPFAFYMKGVPWVANWMWQKFFEFKPVRPPASVWEIPPVCADAVRCPGW